MKSVGHLIQESWSLYKLHIRAFTGYAAWAFIPQALVVLFPLVFPNAPGRELWEAILSLGAFVMVVWVWVILTQLARALSEGQPVKTETIENSVTPLMSPLCIVVLLQTLIIAAGFILFIVPGIIWGVWYAFCTFAVVLDGKAPRQALSFSHDLSRGRFWSTLWTLIAGPFLFSLVYGIAFGIIAALGGTTVESNTLPSWLSALDAAGSTLILLPLATIYMTLLYRSLCSSRSSDLKSTSS